MASEPAWQLKAADWCSSADALKAAKYCQPDPSQPRLMGQGHLSPASDRGASMASQRFPLSYRLIHSHEFDAVFKSADVRVSRPSFLLLAKLNSRGFNRLGMVISKKNVARAVDRNHIKRQIREAFRRLQPADDRTLDVVVLARPPISSDDRLAAVLQASFERMQSKDGAAEKNHSTGRRH